VGYGNGIKSGPVVVMDSKTIKIPAFSYDGKGGEVYFYAGEGPQPSSKVRWERKLLQNLSRNFFFCCYCSYKFFYIKKLKIFTLTGKKLKYSVLVQIAGYKHFVFSENVD